MNAILAEPILVIITGGTALVQAVIQCLIAFGIHVTSEQQAAIMVLCGIIFPLIARTHVTPTAQLPPGVAGQIADANALKASNDAKDKP